MDSEHFRRISDATDQSHSIRDMASLAHLCDLNVTFFVLTLMRDFPIGPRGLSGLTELQKAFKVCKTSSKC